MRLKVLLIGLLLVVAAGGLAWATFGRPLAVQVAQEEKDVPIRVFGLGTIEARVSTRIGFEVAGTLAEVLADHGDRVPKGAVLARINAASQQARVARAEAGLQSADAQQGRSAAAQERATAQYQQKRSTAQRRRELASYGSASPETAEIAETEAAIAQSELAVARADLAVAHAALADATANLAAERTMLAKHTLTAPFEALVIARHREPGAALAPGEAVFTLIAPDSLWALAFVDEGRSGAIQEGQAAEIRLRSLPGEIFPASVVRIGLESDRATEERRVYVKCHRCPPRPTLGEQVQVEIETGRLPSARLVPEAAVDGFDGATGRVWTIEGGVLQQREMRFIARTLDARLALDPALPAGIAVLTRIPPGVRAGRTARVEP
ncbi:MAG: efflux RND transporter periplasmic adaptor subunit [Acetobacteraceae bacterium]